MNNIFLEAKPVWISDREQDVNCRVQFKAVCPQRESAVIHIATSCIYQLYINGKFVSYGPARAGRNHFRLERIDISHYLTAENNIIIIEAAGYFCASFYVMQQPSFLQAEILSNGEVLAVTGKDFSARINPYYIRKVQRYSFQRTFAEAYTQIDNTDSFFTDFTSGDCCVVATEPKTVIERTVPYPDFEVTAATLIGNGAVEKVVPERYSYDRYVLQVGFDDGEATGWQKDELDALIEEDWQKMSFAPMNIDVCEQIESGRYNMYSFEHNSTGMPRLTVVCDRPMTVYLVFDEILTDGKIDPRRTRSCDIVRYKLSEGRHTIQTFEVYTMKYIQVIAVDGKVSVEELSLVEYKHPEIAVPQLGDAKMQLIASAAVETYRQNAVDLFTDCPSRERAGWLCDSFFLARAEHALTGKNIVEEAFLENFLHEEKYENLPEGMVPMCYPADHWSGTFIPNWAMFLAVEMADYKKRHGRQELIDRFKNKLYGILKYFEQFENSDGLLEDLESWVFVEWSRANDSDMVQGVNFPSNMLYYAAITAVAELYGDTVLEQKAERLKSAINAISYNGEFFVDHAIRTADGVKAVNEATEVCQYYAFFCGVASSQTHPELFDRLINEFGPNRDIQTVYPEVHKAAPFIGNYLRLEILKNYGYDDLVTQNIKDYFYYMAERTGTLWETAETGCSCNHGFASCVLYWML